MNTKAKATRMDETRPAGYEDRQPLGFINVRVITTQHNPIYPDPNHPQRPTDIGDMVTRMLHGHARERDEVLSLEIELTPENWKDTAEYLRGFGHPDELFRAR
jgi:hypothetical protein